MILLVVMNTGCLDGSKKDGDLAYSEIEVERILKLNLEGGGPVEYTLSIPVPHSFGYDPTGKQFILEFETENSDTNAQLIKKNDLYYYKGTISGQTTVTVSITYNIQAYVVNWDIYAENSGTIDDVPQDYIDRYVMDRWEVYQGDGMTYRDVDEDGMTPDYHIEPTNPLLRSVAEEIVGNEKNVYMMALKLYDAMRKGINYGNQTFGNGGFSYPTQEQMNDDRQRYFGKPKPAYVTLHDGYNNTNDQAILYITLCRAVGIPAWLEAGVLYNQFSPDPENAWEGHAWAKILIPMNDGYMKQPTVDPVSNLFLKRSANRFSDWEDPGGPANRNAGELPDIPLDIESYYTSWTYRTQSSGLSISFEDAYITHFYKSHKSYREIKV